MVVCSKYLPTWAELRSVESTATVDANISSPDVSCCCSCSDTAAAAAAAAGSGMPNSATPVAAKSAAVLLSIELVSVWSGVEKTKLLVL